jgi:hypothetical protein
VSMVFSGIVSLPPRVIRFVGRADDDLAPGPARSGGGCQGAPG